MFFNTKSLILTIILSGTLSIGANAQDKIIDAFKQSYSLEKTENFKGAIESLKAVYQSDSYELNLRLGWLTYLAGQIQESIDYYSKAVSLKPYAIEPKLGLVLPLSVQGKWNEIEEIYQKILQIDPNNSLVNYRL